MMFEIPQNMTLDFNKFVLLASSYTDNGQGQVLGIGILMGIFAMVFLLSKSISTFDRSITVASLIAAISSIFLRIIGLISSTLVYISIILFVLSFLLIMRQRSNEAP